MTATSEPGRYDDWADTNGDDARARSTFDRADNTARLALEVADLKRERISLEAALDRASRDTVGEARAYRTLLARAEAAEAEVRDLRAKVAAVVGEVDGWRPYETRDIGEAFPADSVRDLIAEVRAALASVGRTEPATLTVESAPLGTRAPAYNGGAWVRVERGWKWNADKSNAGGTFPRPGGDWTGRLVPPPVGRTEPEGAGPLAELSKRGWPAAPAPEAGGE